jgi:hypothetical protein
MQVRVFLVFLCFSVRTLAQQKDSFWKVIRPGLEVKRVKHDFRILAGDSCITLFRIDPGKASFRLACSGAENASPLSAEEWARKENFDLVFNAGMYIPGSAGKARAFMKSGAHINQEFHEPDFGAYFLLDSSKGRGFKLLDRNCASIPAYLKNYRSAFQSLRMVSCSGEPVYWRKNIQNCSMLVTGTDGQGNLILAFTRSPMLHNEMTDFLRLLGEGIHTVIYMEGGPETSIYYRTKLGDQKLIGTYVSKTWERTDQVSFRKIPNVVGIKFDASE